MRKLLMLTGVIITAVGVRAQTQIATVASSAPFGLRGAEVAPGQGVPSWPILAGDNLKAGGALTIVTFSDGSVVTLDPGSVARLDLANGQPVFQLIGGAARYALKNATAVKMMQASQTVTPKGLTGALTAGSSPQAGKFWTAGHTAAIAGGAAAAATGVGLGVSGAIDGGAAASKSQ